jgi:uncharacterized membrane protein
LENQKPEKEKTGWLIHLRNTFLAGILTAVPLVVTYFVLRFLFDSLDGIFQPIFKYFFGRTIPGAGLIALIILVYLLGLVAANLIGRSIIRWFDAGMSRAPVIKYIYTAARQVVDSLRRLQGVPFKKVVIVEFPKPGMYSLAFVTGKPVDFKGQKKIPLFIPHTPNPMTGFLVLLSSNEIIDTDMSIEDAMKMILSGGLLSPETIQ